MAKNASKEPQDDYSAEALERAIQKHLWRSLSGEYTKMPKAEQLLLISWVREAQSFRLEQRKRADLIIRARKLGLIDDIKRLE
jgi:hypothetical protein